MPLRIRVIDSAVAEDLAAFLNALGADAQTEGASVIFTRQHPRAPDEPPEQDRMELEFLVRVWASQRSRPAEFAVDQAA
jgi:hypothetical protein